VTRKEMTEIFSVMMLAWPNAEMFKGGISVLGPTIELWTACTEDIDFWTGKQAVLKLCRSSKYPPTIAEFIGKAKEFKDEVREFVMETFWALNSEQILGGTCESFYKSLPAESPAKMVIDAMGGYQYLTDNDDSWNIEGFRRAYCAMLRANNTSLLGRSTRKELP